MRSKNRISIIAIATLALLPTIAFAAGSTGTGDPANYNMALISLVGLMLILLFVIGMLANTLRQLSIVVRDKNRSERNSKGIVKTILLLLALGMAALPTVAAEATDKAAQSTAAPVSDYIDGIPKNDFYAIMAIISLELIVIFALVIYIKLLLTVIRSKPETAAAAEKLVAQKSWFWENFNAAVPIEKEKDVLLDHNYDGIQELDNSLPPWWKYGFYLTIVVAFIYIYRYHVSNDGPSQQQEYLAEMQQGEEDKAAYLATAGNNVDENTVVLLTEGGDLSAGKDLYIKNCAACHLADGGGTVGPNLTDQYWIHGGSVKDVFKSIKYGWQEKGMKSWKDDFSPKQIQQLASFIRSLKGSHPAVPKDAQGELYIESEQVAPGADSTKTSVVTDTAKATK